MKKKAGTEKHRHHRKSDAGYTLTELLVVLLILGFLGAVVAPQVFNVLTKSKHDTARLQIEALSSVLDLYYIDTGEFPTTEQGLQSLIARPDGVDAWYGPYVKKPNRLKDPWGQEFQYQAPGEHGPFDLYSLGADRVEGGEKENADITNW